MKICSIPYDIVYASPEENFVGVAHALSQVEKDTDVVVLPELFTTAFIPDERGVAELAEKNSGKTVETVKRWSQFFGFAIAGSYLATDGKGKFYNRAFFIEPLGDTTFYDKRHLFPLSTEDKVYCPGEKPAPVIRFRGWSFKLIVCFDLRFPVWCRNIPGNLYDVLLVPANWSHSRSYPFKIFLSARAIENQAYTVGANRSGSDPYGDYKKTDSVINDYMGYPIQETRRNGFLYAILDRDELNLQREKFPVFQPSDKWSLNI